ncbi:hypothetical protein OROMI_004225 [Orobanche minor]
MLQAMSQMSGGRYSRKLDRVHWIFIWLTRDKLYFSSSSSTLIYDNPDIPALIELKVDMSSVELNKAIVPVDFLEPKDGALENLLIWGRNKKNNGFRLELDVSDETAQTVVVLFDETVRDLLKCSPESLLEDDTELKPAPPTGESAGSSNLEAGDGSASSPMKRLFKERLFRIPSVYSVETCDVWSMKIQTRSYKMVIKLG